MTQAFTSHATIDRPAQEVWEALTDWDSAHRWMGNVDQLSADGETAVGTDLTFRARGKERSSSVAAMDPGRSIVLQSIQGGVTADYSYELEPVTESTTSVRLTADCAATGAWKLVAPLLRVVMRRSDGNQMESLKRHVEADHQ